MFLPFCDVPSVLLVLSQSLYGCKSLRDVNETTLMSNKKHSENADTFTSVTFDLDLTSRSRKLMSLLIVLFLGTRYNVCECNSLRDMTFNSFLRPLTFTCDLQLMSRSLSLYSVDVPYVVVHWYQV